DTSCALASPARATASSVRLVRRWITRLRTRWRCASNSRTALVARLRASASTSRGRRLTSAVASLRNRVTNLRPSFCMRFTEARTSSSDSWAARLSAISDAPPLGVVLVGRTELLRIASKSSPHHALLPRRVDDPQFFEYLPSPSRPLTGRIAQLVRAPASHAGGPWFESTCDHFRFMISLRQVRKVYGRGETEVCALGGVSLDVPSGQFVAVVGPSGSGKSTLLHLLGGLDQPTSGEITIGGTRIAGMTDDEITIFRRRRIGFVFQFFNLLPTLTAEENVALPLMLDGRSWRDVRPRVEAVLDLVGLGRRRHHRPDELSGGEMQRVAIARALVIDPLLIL